MMLIKWIKLTKLISGLIRAIRLTRLIRLIRLVTMEIRFRIKSKPMLRMIENKKKRRLKKKVQTMSKPLNIRKRSTKLNIRSKNLLLLKTKMTKNKTRTKSTMKLIKSISSKGWYGKTISRMGSLITVKRGFQGLTFTSIKMKTQNTMWAKRKF